MVVAAVLAPGIVMPRAQAQAAPEALLPDQLLERVGAVSPGAMLDMSFRDTTLVPQFETSVATNNVTSCQLTATQGLFCLDASGSNKGRVVRQWNPVETGQDRVLFSCEDRAFGFDTRASETCTALAVGDDEAIWVAGKKKSNYSLVKVVPKPKDPVNDDGYLACASGWADLQDEPAAQYCFREIAKDRPLLVDATAAKVLLPGGLDCTGVMALELRRTLMFFADPQLNDANSKCLTTGSPLGSFMIADSKGWDLRGSEKLQGVGLFRMQDATRSYALGVSTNGRILAKDTTTALVATDVFNIPAERGSRSTLFEPRLCVAADVDNQYGIRSGEKSGSVVATDYNWCEVMVLEPVTNGVPTAGLKNVVVDGADLTLSTRECPYSTPTCTSSVSYPPLQPTLAPGDSLDLSKCSGPCPWARDDTGELAAVASKVKLVSTETGATLFQIVDIPDCRWLPRDAQGKSVLDICNQGGVIVGGTSPETQSLDVSKLLPKQVTDQFVNDPLPSMLVSPEYRAQIRGIPDPDQPGKWLVEPRYYFDAFFVILEDGVVFTDTYEIEFFVDRLSPSSLGCTATYPSNSWPVSIDTLLQWDIALRISENYQTVVGPDVTQAPAPDTLLGYGDILGNIDCGSVKKGGATLSLLIFNAELTERSEVVFARQVKSLFYDLYWSLAKTACSRVETDGNPAGTVPFAQSTCTTLSDQWEGARDKLSKCLLAADSPKQSEALRNCQSFISQLDGYAATVTASPACTNFDSCNDRANRRGDQLARTMVLKHMFSDRLLPSVPSNGFVDGAYDAIRELPQLPRL
jgi:hypothetical protein